LVESVAPSKATKRDTIKIETLEMTAAPLRLAVVVAFPDHQVNDVRLLTMMWDNIDFYPCNLPATRKLNIDFVLYGADVQAAQKAQAMLRLELLQSGAVKECFGEVKVSGMHEDSQLKQIQATREAAETVAAKDYALMGPPNSEGKINRAGFKAGGGSDLDFDIYDFDKNGLLNLAALEARVAAQTMVARDLLVMRPNSEGKVNRAGFKAGGGSDVDFDRSDSDNDGLLNRVELETRAAVRFNPNWKLDTYYYGAPAMFFSLWRNSQLLSWNYDYIFWCEPDMIPVRHGWLDALYEEIHFMGREGIWQKGSSPQYAHSVDYVSSFKTVESELFHINGNSIYDFKSAEFSKFLMEAAGTIPNSFDFSIYSHLHQHNARQYQLVTQGALKRFQYTGLVMNNPTDLCIPTLGTFLNRYPQVFLVHGRAVRNIRLGSSCCNLFEEKSGTIHRQHSDQYHCLLGEHGEEFVKESWFEDGPSHLSLEQLDQIALGVSISSIPGGANRYSGIPHMAPVRNCFMEADCCLDGGRILTMALNDTKWTERELVLQNLNRESKRRRITDRRRRRQ